MAKATKSQITAIRKLEKKLTDQAMQALLAGKTVEMKKILAERDCQSAWLRVYA